MRRLPTPPLPEIVQSRLRAEFGRFIAAWAQDCLRIRRMGLNRPVSRPGRGLAFTRPAGRLGRLERPADDLSLIEWRPWVEASSGVGGA